jgi:serine/threonine-protein kinase
LVRPALQSFSNEPDETETLDSDARPSGARIKLSGGTPRTVAGPEALAHDWVERALAAEASTRARTFARLVVAFCVIGLACQPALGGAPWLHVVMVATLVVVGLVGCWVAARARTPGGYSRGVARAFGAVCLAASVPIFYYLGVFSPTPMFLVWGVTFFARADDRPAAMGLPAAAAAAYVALASLVALGVLPDAGAVPALAAPAGARLPMIVMVPLLVAATVVQVRRARRATVEALERAEAAAQWAREREAELDAAHAELDKLRRDETEERAPLVGALAGDWRLDALVGSGGMGQVYAATHTVTGGRAAVKVLSTRRLREPLMVKRFLREGEAALKLRAPNVVAVHHVGEMASGAPYIAMELLEGRDLGAILRDEGRLHPDGVIDLVAQVAEGLSAAHAGGVVHRDLKPQNLFLCAGDGARPTWKILDFGISKLAGSSGTLTRRGVVGTPSFMSPEQARGLPTDARSDLFSLGVVAYRALTGRRAFAGPDVPQILFEVVYGAPVRPSALVPALHSDVDLFFVLALAKRADDRFGSAHEMVHALRRATFGALGEGLRARAAALLQAAPWR